MSEDIDMILLDAEEKMDKAIGVARDDFATIRTGRANPAMFNKVFVEFYDTMNPLNQMATISAPEPRMLTISPFQPVRLPSSRSKPKAARTYVPTLHRK